ncbi:hypothetical protein VP01_3638g2 [Puccinia sorghi]|uniref:Uncharacterized protein n=1 Tax=Puccinia sorghi TaxID=27349 RepID=A0A0L6UWJ2_9BASI|nr:hypothetical protein VP01_3638g2 [Puccinia sorghi]
MSEKAVNEDYTFGRTQISRMEKSDLSKETWQDAADYLENKEYTESESSGESDSADAQPFLDYRLGSNTESSDTNWDGRDPSASGWDGRWTAGPPVDNIFDSAMLRVINSLLPRIRYPSWIKRAVPVLGKASNGKLKADEWRNLFQMHLSWSSCELAPNHHMSMHLAECLARFGPVRAWWSFPMERLMGQALHSTHSNRLGELEITFLKTFCWAGNLRVLLDRPELFPDTLKAYIPPLKQLYDPKPEFVSKYTSNLLHSKTLSSLDCQKLADYLNAKPGDTSWLIASEGSSASEAQKRRAAALSSRFHYKFCNLKPS